MEANGLVQSAALGLPKRIETADGESYLRVSWRCIERCCCYIARSGSLAPSSASSLLCVGYACGFLEQLAVGVAQPAVGHHGVGVALRAVVHAGAVSLVARGALLLTVLRGVRVDLAHPRRLLLQLLTNRKGGSCLFMQNSSEFSRPRASPAAWTCARQAGCRSCR